MLGKYREQTGKGETAAMKSVTYGILEERHTLSGISRISYGIAAYANAQEDGTATVLASIGDITSDKQKLEELVFYCNRLKLSVIHLSDVVEDFLGQ